MKIRIGHPDHINSVFFNANIGQIVDRKESTGLKATHCLGVGSSGCPYYLAFLFTEVSHG